MTYRGYTEAQNRATQKYIKNNYTRISLNVRNDDDVNADAIRAAAVAAGESTSEYILKAIRARMDAEATQEAAKMDAETKNRDRAEHVPMQL